MDDEHGRLLPIANVGRIMKRILPPNAKISKEAKVTMQGCASEFISFVTGEASDKCRKENRKTVYGDDICCALSSLGFDIHADASARYLYKLRESEKERDDNRKLVISTEGIGETPIYEGSQQLKEPNSLTIRVMDRKA